MSFVQGVGTDATTSANDAPNLRPFANLNLTDDQTSQIRTILQNGQSQGLSQTDIQNQINNVLTPQQQQTLQTDLQANKGGGHHGHHHHHGGGSSSSSAAASSTSSTQDPTLVPADPTLANGVSVTDIQNQNSAASNLAAQQLQNQVLNNGSGST
jgi:hypothetical protein